MYKISVKSFFSAAHFLKNYRGKCENLHGHNWEVTATISGENLKNGLLMDFSALKRILKSLLARFDHKSLNELKEFKKINTTSENIARVIFLELKKQLPENVSLEEVAVSETPTNRASYSE
ncbi:MAG: 6-carboxytetrahydropterin synthase QueD [Elusimicrobia bacterium]|nr:6-carboxytetrahydropterin synthase QueD [Elusimicrobiota bacterium]